MKKLYLLIFLISLTASSLSVFASRQADGTMIKRGPITFEITVQPVNTVLCEGTNGILNITATGEQVLTYNWFLDGVALGNDDSESTLTVSLAGEYYCEVYMVGEVNPLTSETVDVSIAVVEPTLDAEVSDCDGATVILNPGTFDSYLWSDASTETTLSVTEANTYSVTVTDVNGCTGVASSTVSFTVVEPTLDAEISACDGATVILNPGTFDSYLWSDASTETTLSVTETNTYSVTVTDVNGCTGVASSTVSFDGVLVIDLGPQIEICAGDTINITAAESDSYLWGAGQDTQEISVSQPGWYYVTVTQGFCTGNDSVRVLVFPTPNTFAFEDIFACAGATTTISGPDQIGIEYLWSTSETTPSINVTSNGNYSLTVTNMFGCSLSDDVNVEYYDEVIVNLHTSDSLSACVGTPVVLKPNFGVSWLWNTGSQQSALNVTLSGMYSVTVTATNGCKGIDSVYVSFGAIPVIDLGADQAFCDELSTVLTAPESASYLWSTGDTSQSITITETGIYSCTITAENGCSKSDAMTLTVYPLPIVDLGNDVIVDYNQMLIFSAELGHPIYNWSTGAITDFILVHTSDLNIGLNTISVTVQSLKGCISTDEVVLNLVPGSDVETQNANICAVYPNPTSGLIKINSENAVHVDIYDYVGRKIISTSNTEINISEFADGIYTVVVVSNDKTYTSKIVKQ